MSSRAALGFSLPPFAPCSAGAQLFAKPEERKPWETLLADLEKQIPGLMAEEKTAGLSIAIIRDAKVLWRRGFGVRDSGSKEPVDNDTTFEAASVSKTVFAYAVMKLCEKGVINLDQRFDVAGARVADTAHGEGRLYLPWRR